MVIQHSQRMASGLASLEIAFEVDLPKIIGLGMLEALPGGAVCACRLCDQAMSVQNPGNGAGGWNLGVAVIEQAAMNLAASPSWVFQTHRHYQLLACLAGTQRRIARSARAVLQASRAVCNDAFK